MQPIITRDRVAPERWQEAQRWEKEHWLHEERSLARSGKNIAWKILATLGIVDKYRGDDRNKWWEKALQHYSFLPSAVESAIEVGCGPYTNMRLIYPRCRPRRIALSDPLIRTYAEFPMTFIREMRNKEFCVLDDHPLEELPFPSSSFDLAVKINVLDHVRDAHLCMENFIRILKPGGIAIWGQDLTNAEGLRRTASGVFVGHPIMIDEHFCKPYLERFEPIILEILPPERPEWAPDWHYAHLVFAGRKL